VHLDVAKPLPAQPDAAALVPIGQAVPMADVPRLRIVGASSAVLTVAVVGEMDLEENRDIARQLSDALEATPPPTLVLDLTGVTFIDSSGLAALVNVRNQGWRVQVIPSAIVRRVIEASGLDTVFQLLDPDDTD
jgi:anti-anti-sigma factor